MRKGLSAIPLSIISFYLSYSQLLKGAALNAGLIAEEILCR